MNLDSTDDYWKCANCNKPALECILQRCSGCDRRYYCSKECFKMNWNAHKVECKQFQANMASIRDELDANHPFEELIITFEALGFTYSSFISLMSVVRRTYIYEPDGNSFNYDMDIVTETGYERLLRICVRAVKEFPDSYDVIVLAVEVFTNFACRYTNRKMGFSRVKWLHEAGVLGTLVHCLRKYPTDQRSSLSIWIVLMTWTRTDQTKHLEALGAADIFDLAIETLKVHGNDEKFTVVVVPMLSRWLRSGLFRHILLPPYNSDALVLTVVLSMRRFPSAEKLQAHSCFVLRALFPSHLDIADYEVSTLAVSLASLGAFERIVAAIQSFPSNSAVVVHGCEVLVFIAKLYFAGQTKPRNTDACVALVAAAPHNVAEIKYNSIFSSIRKIMQFSPASAAKFVHPGNGLQLLKSTLEASIVENDSSLLDICCGIIGRLCDELTPDHAHVMTLLESTILPVAVQGIKDHLHSSDGDLVMYLLHIAGNIAVQIRYSLDEFVALVQEAMRLHPSIPIIQDLGEAYLSAVGLANIVTRTDNA